MIYLTLENEYAKKDKTKGSTKRDHCPECNSSNIVYDPNPHEYVCGDCGIVLEKSFDMGPERNAYTPEERDKRERTGSPSTYTMHDKGLSTQIDSRNRDIHGKKLSPGQASNMYRLRKWHRRTRVRDPLEKIDAYALSKISKGCGDLNLPKIVCEQASADFVKAHKQKLIRGRGTPGVAAGSVYLACRQNNVNRSPEDIARYFDLNEREVERNYRNLIKGLDCKVSPQDSRNYISKISNQLAIEGKIEGIANNIFSAAKEGRLTSGKSPSGVAAAAIYMSSILVGKKVTQREIADAAEVTEVTVRNRYKDLMKGLNINIRLHPQENNDK